MIAARVHAPSTVPPRVIVAILCITALTGSACGDDPPPSTMSLTDSTRLTGGQDASMDCESALLETFEISGAAHVEQPQYPDPPPVGGDHLGCWVDYAVYAEPVDPGNWVHNLEHGAVVLLHDCDGDCDAELSQLRVFAEANERIVMTPYAGLPTRFAAVAWGRRLTMDCLHMPSVEAFYDDFFDMGPESVPSGKPAGC